MYVRYKTELFSFNHIITAEAGIKCGLSPASSLPRCNFVHVCLYKYYCRRIFTISFSNLEQWASQNVSFSENVYVTSVMKKLKMFHAFAFWLPYASNFISHFQPNGVLSLNCTHVSLHDMYCIVCICCSKQSKAKQSCKKNGWSPRHVHVQCTMYQTLITNRGQSNTID